MQGKHDSTKTQNLAVQSLKNVLSLSHPVQIQHLGPHLLLHLATEAHKNLIWSHIIMISSVLDLLHNDMRLFVIKRVLFQVCIIINAHYIITTLITLQAYEHFSKHVILCLLMCSTCLLYTSRCV